MRFNVPKRTFCTGRKKMFSMRMHAKLHREIIIFAKNNGYSKTELIETVLNEFLQQQVGDF